MACKVCRQQNHAIFKQKILNKYDIQYYYCDACGFLQTEKPYWLDEAYSDAIAGADTGLVQRNLLIVRQLSMLLFMLFGKKGRYVDFAGGTGLLVRMMRDVGFDYFWKDRYCANIHARGFEFSAGLNDCLALTAFEALEHLEDPVAFIKDALKQANTDTFIFTTELFTGKPPAPGDWWYYAPETGQHISFYQHRTLQTIADRMGLHLYSASGFHMMTPKKISSAIFKLAVSRWSRLFFPVIRWLMDSKTMDDHYKLLRSRN